jgi:hypothetical protein
MKQLLTGCVAVLFGLSLGVGGARPAAQEAVKDGAKKVGDATVEGTKKAGEATKEGAKKTGEAAKKAGDATVGEAKKAGEATAEGTKAATKATTDTTTKAGTSVKNVFTGEVSATCADGKKHSGKTKDEACAKHGGVKP